MLSMLIAGLLSASPDPGSATAWPATLAEVIAATSDGDWRRPEPEQLLYLDLASGDRVVIELAPQFAPRHVRNIKILAGNGYYDGLPIVRSQDNYVVQWGDPDGKRDQGEAAATLAPEFDRSSEDAPAFTASIDGDVYAPEVGFMAGFPSARDPASKTLWLAHCYAMVGVGRGNAIDSGNGSELYVVNGHAPRHLDRNVTLVGRVLHGMEALSSMPRGSGAMGFYAESESRPTIRRLRLGSAVPEAERVDLQVLRTDGEAFQAVIKARRHRRESWFHTPTGKVEVCNVPLPVRVAEQGPVAGSSAKSE